jgi:ribosome-associated translation inhibitor RaiA
VSTHTATRTAARGESPIEIVSRGPIGERSRRRLRRELERLSAEAPRRAVFVRGALSFEQNPSVERPAHASATIDLGRRTVRASVAAAGTADAIDLLVRRLRRALRDLRGRDEAARHHRAPGHHAGAF